MRTDREWLFPVLFGFALGACPSIAPCATPAVSAGDDYACALTQAGAVKCWGLNNRGQLGDGSTISRSTAVDVVGLASDVVAISAGAEHACAITADGAAKCWGSNNYGQLGDGTTTRRHAPVDVVGLASGVAAISAAVEHTCALMKSGVVRCWGGNANLQLGFPTWETSVPVEAQGLPPGVVAIAASMDNSCILTSAGSVSCWGYHHSLQGACQTINLGCFLAPCGITICGGIPVNEGRPSVVPGMEGGFAAIAMPTFTFHNYALCGLTHEGGLVCGRLFESSSSAMPVPAGGVRALAMGRRHTCVLGVDGAVSCWGENLYGEVGLSRTVMWRAPPSAPIEGLPRNVVSLAAGAFFSCAMTSDGQAYCWGRNSDGQLGDGSPSNAGSARPVAVVGLSPPNYTAHWWNPAESGWGITFNHQGDKLFAVVFTYDALGSPMWLVAPNGVQAGGRFSGPLYRTTGSAFNASPFAPIGPGNITSVGNLAASFATASTSTVTYSVDGVTVTKAVEKQVFGARAASCVAAEGDRSWLVNYQDLWWNPSEAGWGLGITHQGDTIFATLFTYGLDGQGIWWVVPNAPRQPDGSYSGTLYQTTGAAFNANPWPANGPGNATAVGTLRLAFTNGATGSLTYTVNGTSVTRAIVRQVFASTVPACSN